MNLPRTTSQGALFVCLTPLTLGLEARRPPRLRRTCAWSCALRFACCTAEFSYPPAATPPAARIVARAAPWAPRLSPGALPRHDTCIPH